MLYYGHIMMKRLLRLTLVIGIGSSLVLFSAGMTHSVSSLNQGTATGTAFTPQVTITPPPEDQSVVGSTDGVVIMGVITALIIFIPILAQRKSWMRIS
jgi:hypothetical protein